MNRRRWMFGLVAWGMVVATASAGDWSGGLFDPGMHEPASVALPADGSPISVQLPFPILYEGRTYFGLEASAHGWARLRSTPVHGTPAPATTTVVQPGDLLATGADEDRDDVGSADGPLSTITFQVLDVTPGPDAGGRLGSDRLLVHDAGNFLALRWYRFHLPGHETTASFDLLIDRSGNVRYQYYVLPTLFGGALPRVGSVESGGRSRRLANVATSLKTGAHLDLDTLVAPDELGGTNPIAVVDCSGCGSEIGWCDEARAVSAGCTSYIEGRTCAAARASGYSCCIDEVNRNPPWRFRENAFCIGCSYTFYVLVECGTEMHLPFDDMEGARVRVTEFLSGTPISLTCQNEQFLVPGYHFVNCDRAPTGAGPEDSYYDAPLFYQTNAADPTQYVSWGFDDANPCETVSSKTNCSLWTPGTGPISASPGEQEVVDCFIGNSNGLCGLYRVEILSGGYDWYLYSNCDGLRTPDFQIFDTCADACTAYVPRPELTVANLWNSQPCPLAQIEFDIINIGCADVPEAAYRITSNCPVPDVKDGIWPGGVRANTAVHVSQPFSVSCMPARITVSIDPDNRLPDECSESPTASKCREITGAESIAIDSCTCLAAMTPRAGSPIELCAGGSFALDASSSASAGCPGTIQYRWSDDATGTEVCAWSSDPICTPAGQPFASGTTVYRLEMRCSVQSACKVATTLPVTIYALPLANAGPDNAGCLGVSFVLGGDVTTPTGTGGSGAYTYAWTPATDLSSPTSANPVFLPTAEGTFIYRVTVTDAFSGCSTTDDIEVVVGVGGAPGDLGNVLRAVRSGIDAVFYWNTLDPLALTFNIRRGDTKDTFALSLDAIVGPDLPASPWTDVGAIPAPPSTTRSFYRVSGMNCGSSEGPY